MQISAAGPVRFAGFVTFVTVLLVVVILRVAEDVIVPISLSVLLAFLLTPSVNKLARWGLPDPLAIGLTATLAFALLASVAWTVGTQVVGVLEELPKYEQNIRAKIAALKQLNAPAPLSRTRGLVENLQKDVAELTPSVPEGATADKNTRPPVSVAIAETQETPLEIFRKLAAPALGPLGTGGIVVIFVLAILFQRHDLRDRFIRLISAGQINMATQAVDDAAKRVSRYLGMQLLVNATYGIPVGIGLHFIGVPGAVLWGVLATVLRFIPFLGPWIAAAFPLTLAIAIDPGWTKVLYTAGLFLTLELISNNVIEVVVYGSTTGISSFALLVAAVFWTWLWGTAGLFLSTPLTVCLLVIGKYVPGLKFLSVLLGNEPALTPPTIFYQRMLSMNFEQMHELATRYVAEKSLTAFFDEVFIPALSLAEEDRHAGELAEIRQRFILQAGRELIEELAGDVEENQGETAPADAAHPAAAPLLGIAARDEADELVALMLQQLLRLRGIDVEVSPVTASPADHVAIITKRKITTAFLSALPPSALVDARRACRWLKTGHPTVHVLTGIWSPTARAEDLKPRFLNPPPDEVVTTLAAAVSYMEKLGEIRRVPLLEADAATSPTPKKPAPSLRDSLPQAATKADTDTAAVMATNFAVNRPDET